MCRVVITQSVAVVLFAIRINLKRQTLHGVSLMLFLHSNSWSSQRHYKAMGIYRKTYRETESAENSPHRRVEYPFTQYSGCV